MWESVRYKNRKTNDRENHWNVRNESSLLPDDDEDRSPSANRIADLMLFHNEQPIIIFEVAFSQTKQNAINAAIGLLRANKFTKLACVFNINERKLCPGGVAGCTASDQTHPTVQSNRLRQWLKDSKEPNSKARIFEEELGESIHWLGVPVWGGITTMSLYMVEKLENGTGLVSNEAKNF
jgi:hypothetical protein